MVGWIARFLLIAAGTVTGWFVARDEPNFGVIQLATALLLLTFMVAVLAFRPARWTAGRQWFSGAGQRPDRGTERGGTDDDP